MPSRPQSLNTTRQEATPNTRPAPSRRGYGRLWQRVRLVYLADHPWCRTCLDRGLYVAADVVDHIRPHKGDVNLFWNVDNWQSLCKPCHDRKTAIQDGGFGRAFGSES